MPQPLSVSRLITLLQALEAGGQGGLAVVVDTGPEFTWFVAEEVHEVTCLFTGSPRPHRVVLIRGGEEVK